MSKVTLRPSGSPSCVYLNFTNFISTCNSNSTQGPGASLHSLTRHTAVTYYSHAGPEKPCVITKNYFKYPSLLLENQWTRLEQEGLRVWISIPVSKIRTENIPVINDYLMTMHIGSCTNTCYVLGNRKR